MRIYLFGLFLFCFFILFKANAKTCDRDKVISSVLEGRYNAFYKLCEKKYHIKIDRNLCDKLSLTEVKKIDKIIEMCNKNCKDKDECDYLKISQLAEKYTSFFASSSICKNLTDLKLSD